MPESPVPPSRSSAEIASFVVTNLIKLGGLIIVFHEVFAQEKIRSAAIGVAALMMAGAQSLDAFITSFFGGGKR